MPARALFDRLKEQSREDWRRYVEHPFVARLADGSLPEAAFRHYLAQDYLFLIHFARAWGLAVFKSETIEDMRQAAAMATGILDVEMNLHVEFCKGWGLSEADMRAQPEARQTMAYTRFVLEKGLSGDVLDLHVALAPCVIGYGEIGARLGAAAEAGSNNPYQAWIDMYAGDDYQAVTATAKAQLDRLFAARGSEARLPALAGTFRGATRLEADFWQMGLDAAGG